MRLSSTSETKVQLAARPAAEPSAARPRPRGRPSMMSRSAVLDRIRQLATSDHGLYRIHRHYAGLYARARRQFGSWSGAVKAAGVDYAEILERARRRSIETRRRKRLQRVRLAG